MNRQNVIVVIAPTLEVWGNFKKYRFFKLAVTLSVSFSKGLRKTTLSNYTKLNAGYCPTITH